MGLFVKLMHCSIEISHDETFQNAQFLLYYGYNIMEYTIYFTADNGIYHLFQSYIEQVFFLKGTLPLSSFNVHSVFHLLNPTCSSKHNSGIIFFPQQSSWVPLPPNPPGWFGCPTLHSQGLWYFCFSTC